MTKLFLTVVLLVITSVVILAQQPKLEFKKSDVLIDQTKPTLYLTFERLENVPKGNDKGKGQDANRIVWLRFHNNTRWVVRFRIEDFYSERKIGWIPLSRGGAVIGLQDGAAVEIRYGVEAQQGIEYVRLPSGNKVARNVRANVPVIQWGHIAQYSWIGSGHSFIFPVPRKYFGKNLQLFVPFVYEWETSRDDFGLGEVQHRVHFRFEDLPTQ